MWMIGLNKHCGVKMSCGRGFWLFVFLVLGAGFCDAAGSEQEIASENCDNFLSCMNIDLFNNVTRIGNEDVYKITDNLLLEKYATRNESESELVSRRKLAKKNAISTYTLMKKIMGLFETHALRYKLTRGLDLAVFKDEVDGVPKISVGLITDEPSRGARTFGVAIFRKRMMYILLAMTFKLGIMTSLLATILVLVLKGLKIGVLLLMLTFGSVFAKWKSYDTHHHADHTKGIHVHVHNDPHHQAYSAWAPEVPYHHTGIHRRNNGELYSVREDANIGYPAVFRPPLASAAYQQKSGQVYIPTRGQSQLGQNPGIGQYLAAAGLGYGQQGTGYRAYQVVDQPGYSVTEVDRRGGVPIVQRQEVERRAPVQDYGVGVSKRHVEGVRTSYEVERQPEFAQVYSRRSGYEDDDDGEGDDEEVGGYAN